KLAGNRWFCYAPFFGGSGTLALDEQLAAALDTDVDTGDTVRHTTAERTATSDSAAFHIPGASFVAYKVISPVLPVRRVGSSARSRPPESSGTALSRARRIPACALLAPDP